MLSHSLRQQSVAIPILRHAMIGDPPERHSRRREKVRWQDRFPDNHHADSGVGMFVQQLLDCGGPPQTDSSSRREHRNDADRTGRAVEARF